VSYNWSWAGGTASGVNPTITLPLGPTTIELIVNDGALDSDPDTVTITVEDTTPPTLIVPASVTAEQTSLEGTPVNIPASATDICDADVTITSDELAVYPLGDTTVTFTATDDSGNVTTDQTIVQIEDTTPPDVDAGSDQTVPEGTPVTLNGIATDICDASLDYEWREGAIVLGNSATLVHTFPVGIHTVTLEATDDSGNSGTDDVIVTVTSTGDENTEGKVTGGGWFRINNFKRVLSVNVEYVGGAFTSSMVRYLNYSDRGRMDATTLTKFVISGGTVDIEGTCKYKGVAGHTFTLQIVDGSPDSFDLTIKDAGGSIVDSAAGSIAAGDFVVTSY
jgi:hypothetical protein